MHALCNTIWQGKYLCGAIYLIYTLAVSFAGYRIHCIQDITFKWQCNAIRFRGLRSWVIWLPFCKLDICKVLHSLCSNLTCTIINCATSTDGSLWPTTAILSRAICRGAPQIRWREDYAMEMANNGWGSLQPGRLYQDPPGFCGGLRPVTKLNLSNTTHEYQLSRPR